MIPEPSLEIVQHAAKIGMMLGIGIELGGVTPRPGEMTAEQERLQNIAVMLEGGPVGAKLGSQPVPPWGASLGRWLAELGGRDNMQAVFEKVLNDLPDPLHELIRHVPEGRQESAYSRLGKIRRECDRPIHFTTFIGFEKHK